MKVAIIGDLFIDDTGTAMPSIESMLCAISLIKLTQSKIVLISQIQTCQFDFGVTSLSQWALDFHSRLQMKESDYVLKNNGSFQIGTLHDYSNSPVYRSHNQLGNFVIGEGTVGIDLYNVQFQHHLRYLHGNNTQAVSYEPYSLSCAMAKHNKFIFPSEDNKSILSTLSYRACIDEASYQSYLYTCFKTLLIANDCEHIITTDIDIIGKNGQIIQSDELVIGPEIKQIKSDNTVTELDLLVDARDASIAQLSNEAENSRAKADNHNYKFCYSFTVKQPPSARKEVSMLKGGILVSNSARLHTAFKFYSQQTFALSDLSNQLKKQCGLEVDPKQINLKCVEFTAPDLYWQSNYINLNSGKALSLFEYSNIELSMRIIDQICLLFPVSNNMKNIALEVNANLKQAFACIEDYEAAYLFMIAQLASKGTVAADSIFKPSSNLTENVKHTIGLFAESGRLRHREHDPIDDVKWISTFLALGLNIDTYDPMLDIQKDENLPKIFANIEAQITKTVSQLPSISDYIGL
jgi:hypothetical protein